MIRLSLYTLASFCYGDSVNEGWLAFGRSRQTCVGQALRVDRVKINAKIPQKEISVLSKTHVMCVYTSCILFLSLYLLVSQVIAKISQWPQLTLPWLELYRPYTMYYNNNNIMVFNHKKATPIRIHSTI